MTNFHLMLYEHLMFYYSIIIFSPIIQTIFPSLSFQHTKSKIYQIHLQILKWIEHMFKIFKTIMFTFLGVLPSLVLLLINRMENTYNGFSIFKGNYKITKFLRWGSRRMIFDRESFPYQFCIPMKKKVYLIFWMA